METFASEVLGITTLADWIWNVIAWTASLSVIVVAAWFKEYFNQVVTVAGSALGLYAAFFLHDPLFTTIQIIVATTAIMLWINAARSATTKTLIALTAAAYTLLWAMDLISNTTAFVGSLGLVALAAGLIFLPSFIGWAIMTGACVILSYYSFEVSAWVFLFLNVALGIVNIRNTLVGIFNYKSEH